MCLKVKVAQEYHTVPKQKPTTIHVFPQKKIVHTLSNTNFAGNAEVFYILNMLHVFLLFCQQYVHECHAVDT